MFGDCDTFVIQRQCHDIRLSLYREVQLNLTPEIEVFYMMFGRYPSIFSMKSLKQHMEYFNFLC